MTTIAIDKSVTTLITVYQVEPVDQQRLIDLLTTTYQQFVMRQPGFISGHILRGQEGTRVASYAQWESRAAAETMLHSDAFWPVLLEIQRIAVADPWFYEVVGAYTSSDDHP